METAVPLRPLVRLFGHTTVVLFLLTSAFFVAPLGALGVKTEDVLRLGTSLVLLTLVGYVFRVQLRRSARDLPGPYTRILWLLTTLYLLVLAFAMTYAVVSFNMPGQFVNLTDRVDALYYSVTLVATVGFGDIHASGTLAQLLATAHMVINLVYIGTALRMLTTVSPTASEPP